MVMPEAKYTNSHTHTHLYALTMYTEDPAFRERPCIRRMNDAIRANYREHILRTDQQFRDRQPFWLMTSQVETKTITNVTKVLGITQ